VQKPIEEGSVFLGIDIGTTGIKASITDPVGNIISEGYHRLYILGLNEDKRELNPHAVWEGVISAANQALCNCGNPIELIMVSSLGEAIVLVDKDDEPVMNSIIGSDRRGADQLAYVKTFVPENELTDITGLNLSTIYSLNKILYLKQQYPVLYKRIHHVFCIADYIVYRMTGESVIDYSLASRTMAFDYNRYCWSSRILDAVDISSDLFSNTAISGTVVGTLQPEIAATLRLPTNTKVAIGAHDHLLNALGVGAVTLGICSNATGTTEGLTVYLGTRRLPRDIICGSNISCEPFVIPNTFCTVAWHNTAGAMLNWYADILFQNTGSHADVIAKLQLLDAQCRREPSRLMVMPHFSGATTNNMDNQSRGAVIGLSLSTTREELYKALLEGTAYEIKLILHALENS
jgi:xylulokinase